MDRSTTPHKLRLVDETHGDAGWVLRAQRGDTQAFEELFLRHAEPLARWVAGVALGVVDSDDIVQDTFILAFERLRSIKDPNAFRAWIRSIAVSLLRRKFRNQKLLRKLRLVGPAATPILPLASNAPPEVVAEAKQLAALLEALPADEGLALVLRRVDGYQLDEIAELLNLSLATVKRRLASAESHLTGVQENFT